MVESQQIQKLEEYFRFRDFIPRDINKNPNLAQRAISLLDKIKEFSGIEYAFFDLQNASPFGGCCEPLPISSNFSNPRFPIVLGIYNRAYFVDFLKNREQTQSSP